MDKIDFIKTLDSKNPNIEILTDPYGNYIKIDTYPTKSMMVEEFRAKNPNVPVVEILYIYVRPEYRRKGFGTTLLQVAIERYKKSAILALVGASEEEYPKLEESNIQDILRKLMPFYTMNHFVPVNNVYGTYNSFMPVLYTGNNWETVSSHNVSRETLKKNINRIYGTVINNEKR